MGNEITAEQVDACNNVGEIIAVVREEISALKDFIAKRDVDIVRRSTKGVGTNESDLVSTLCGRTKKQLDAVDLIYHTKYESSLLKVVKSDISGDFGKMMGYALLDTDDFGSEIFTLATKGMGTKEHVLIDFVHTHTNAQIAAVKKKWEAKNNKSMLDCINSEFSGNAKKIMTLLIMGHKSESTAVDNALAGQQAAALHAAGVKKLIGTDHDVFLDILGKSSRAQIQAIRAAYEHSYGMSLMKAVNKGCGGTYRKVLLGCLFPTSEAYTAYALFKAFEGVGTDEARVCRLLGGTDKRKTCDVAAYYLDTYGKTIVEDLKDELSGNFLKAAVAWVAGGDPTKGLEYITEKALADNDPYKRKNLAKALLQERANLLDFICQVDASDIRSACNRLGTNDLRLISVICGRTKSHLARVDLYYHSLYGMSLETQVKHECFGNYKDFLVHTLMPEADFDALMLKKAMDGVGTNEKLIIQIMAPQSNARILAAKARHDQKYPKALIDRLKSELSGATEDLVIALLKGERQEDLVDEGLAVQQAKQLHDAGIGKRMGTDKKTFIRILSQASREQIQLIRKHYERNHGMSLERAIKKECSGSFETMLLAMLMQPIAYYALQLREAFQGVGSDKTTIARVLGGNDKPTVQEIADYYRDTYGETLLAALKRELSGRLRRATLTWVAATDPVHAGDKLAEAMEGLPEDEPCAEDEVIVDTRDVATEPEPEQPPPPSYDETTQGTAGHAPPPPQHHGGGGPPPPQYGSGPVIQINQFYQAPPPPPPVYYVPPPPAKSRGSSASVEALGGMMASGLNFLSSAAQNAAQARQKSRAPPPPYAGDDDASSSDEDSDDDDEGSRGRATPEQIEELKRLTKRRTKAVMAGDAQKVHRMTDRINYLKYQISTQ